MPQRIYSQFKTRQAQRRKMLLDLIGQRGQAKFREQQYRTRPSTLAGIEAAKARTTASEALTRERQREPAKTPFDYLSESERGPAARIQYGIDPRAAGESQFERIVSLIPKGRQPEARKIFLGIQGRARVEDPLAELKKTKLEQEVAKGERPEVSYDEREQRLVNDIAAFNIFGEDGRPRQKYSEILIRNLISKIKSGKQLTPDENRLYAMESGVKEAIDNLVRSSNRAGLPAKATLQGY